ncbi:MAG: KDO2-lipid IV(A) lauroyltransferase [Candidatus Krumholzibacteriia bacterium]
MAKPVTFKHRVEYAIFFAIYKSTNLMPRSWYLAVGRGLGWFAWNVMRFRRQVILDNIRASFGPEKDDAWVKNVAAAFYRNLGMSVIEFLASGHESRETILANTKIEGREHLDGLIAEGRGAIVLASHLGNFELVMTRFVCDGYIGHGSAKPQSNALVDEIHNGIRLAHGGNIVPLGDSFRHFCQVIAKGEFVGLLADQDAGSRGMFVDFLGRAASVNRGPATLAVKTRCPFLMTFMIRQPDHTNVLRFGPVLEIDPSWNNSTAIRKMTEMQVAEIEKVVREYPEMYYWVHRRWKTRPPENEKS